MDKRGYTEEGIRYDKNGNILNLIRRANGNIVDNLVYSYTGNRLSSLREKAPGGISGDVYVRGVSESGGYAYDANGNMVKDMRRGLELRYNSLNLLDGVNIRNGRSIRYLRLSDGRKLGIRFSDGSPGYDYSGNMTYKVTKGRIERESLAFGGGCIASTGFGSYEVRYWLRDHLGSVRAVRTASGRVVEENAYYPFGLRQRRQDYAVSGNRYRYNGKEEQWTFGYLDYGFRMYDACLGRWHSSDPLSERDPGISGYAYVKNAPLRYRDILGLTYTGYGDVPPYKYRWTSDGYELEEVVVTAPRGGSGYAFPILGNMGYSRQSGALWRTVFTWERYFESASDLHSVYGNASPHTSYDASGPHSLHPDSHIPSGGVWYDNASVYIAGAVLTAENVYNNYYHNHTTYTTTKGVVKNIYKTNGEVRSARAARFARTSTIVKILGIIGTAFMTVQAGTKIYDGSAIAWDYGDFTVGSVGTVAGTAELMGGTSCAVPGVGEAVAAYAWFRLWFDLGAQYGPSKWYGNDDARWSK